MPNMRESALPKTTAPGLHGGAVHLVSRVASGLSDAALAELVTAADRLRFEEGLLPVEFTAQW